LINTHAEKNTSIPAPDIQTQLINITHRRVPRKQVEMMTKRYSLYYSTFYKQLYVLTILQNYFAWEHGQESFHWAHGLPFTK